MKTCSTCATNLATMFCKNIPLLLCSREHMIHFVPFNVYVSSHTCKILQNKVPQKAGTSLAVLACVGLCRPEHFNIMISLWPLAVIFKTLINHLPYQISYNSIKMVFFFIFPIQPCCNFHEEFKLYSSYCQKNRLRHLFNTLFPVN